MTNGDIVAWPEVWFQGSAGWVALDPTPPALNMPAPPVPEVSNAAAAIARAVASAGPGAGPGSSQDVTSHNGSGPYHSRSASSWAADAALILAVAILLLGALGAFIAAAKRRRRLRRRTSGSPGARILGAWSQSVDHLTERGLPTTYALTATEVAEAARKQVGLAAEPVAPLGNVLNRALYDAGTPGSEEAEAAWRCVDQLEAGLQAGVSRVEGGASIAVAEAIVDPCKLKFRR